MLAVATLLLLPLALDVIFGVNIFGSDDDNGSDIAPEETVELTDNWDFEVLRGNAPQDVSGLGGNDAIDGRGGDDILRGNTGDDVLNGGNGDDTLFGGTGDDVLSGRKDDDLVMGGFGNDFLMGGEGDDNLFGGDGADFLEGAEGSDQLYGGAGNDILTGDRFFDEDNDFKEQRDLRGDRMAASDLLADEAPVIEGEEAPLVEGEELPVVEGVDTPLVEGEAPAEEEVAEEIATTLVGTFKDADFGAEGQTADLLVGGAGDDTLILGANDIGIGGADSDLFTILGGEARADDGGASVILDFNADEDTIVVALPEGADAGEITYAESSIEVPEQDAIPTIDILVDGVVLAKVANTSIEALTAADPQFITTEAVIPL